MKKLRERFTPKDLMGWLTIQTLVLLGSAVLSFIIVELLADTLFGPRERGNTLVLSLMMILPMAVLITGLNYVFSKYTFKHVKLLSGAMEKAADGDFDTRLDTYHAGPLNPVYENFNAMCEELQSVKDLHSDFVNNYSHEFKTPIVSITGFADLLLEAEVTEDQRRQYLEIIRKESAGLADLANSTILMARLDTQTIIGDKTPFRLDEQIRYCVVLLSKRWYEKSIEFEGDMQPILYNGNQELMRHVWLNLIGNAVKFAPEKGHIFVRLAETDNIIAIDITDDGPGMEENDAKHVFDKYYQVDKAKTKQGLGLGLSIVQRIVELNNGSITVKSSPNKGSTFSVVLPK